MLSALVGLSLMLVLGCKKTDDPGSGTANTTPTSLVGNWKVTSLTMDPAWPKVVNGSPERFTDYVQYLKRINETCLTDVTWTFAQDNRITTNKGSLPTCGANGPNSTFIVDYLVDPNGTYKESANQVELIGTGNLTSLTVGKSFAPGNLVTLQWKDQDLSNQGIQTTYMMTLMKQ